MESLPCITHACMCVCMIVFRLVHKRRLAHVVGQIHKYIRYIRIRTHTFTKTRVGRIVAFYPVSSSAYVISTSSYACTHTHTALRIHPKYNDHTNTHPEMGVI